MPMLTPCHAMQVKRFLFRIPKQSTMVLGILSEYYSIFLFFFYILVRYPIVQKNEVPEVLIRITSSSKALER